MAVILDSERNPEMKIAMISLMMLGAAGVGLGLAAYMDGDNREDPLAGARRGTPGQRHGTRPDEAHRCPAGSDDPRRAGHLRERVQLLGQSPRSRRWSRATALAAKRVAKDVGSTAAVKVTVARAARPLSRAGTVPAAKASARATRPTGRCTTSSRSCVARCTHSRSTSRPGRGRHGGRSTLV